MAKTATAESSYESRISLSSLLEFTGTERKAWPVFGTWLLAATLLVGMAMPPAARGQAAADARGAQADTGEGQLDTGGIPVKTTYVRLAENANALLIEPIKPSRNERIIAINTHPADANNFEYFAGRQMVARGYRVLEINHYGAETTMEQLLPPIAAAVRYARSVPGVKTVVLLGHSGGGPEVSYYQEIAENGPSACQTPDRIYPCDSKGLTDLPKADALLLLEANAGAPHRTLSIDPAVNTSDPKARNPALDMYAPQNGFDAATNSASYSADFVKQYSTALHYRSEGLIADAQARLKAIKDHTGPFNDDEPFVVAGMADHDAGSRLYVADPKILSRTHAPHMELKADGTRPVAIIETQRRADPTPVRQRDTLAVTTQNVTVRHFLSFLALRTTPDFEMTADDIKGVDWHSSANSDAGNVQNIKVPTLIMAGGCMNHMDFLEIAYDRSAAKDKEFVVVEGGDHYFRPCRPEFGDTRKRAFDYVDSWLAKRF